MAAKKKHTIPETKTAKQQAKLLTILEEYPIIQVACQKAGVGRATYYKWRTEDKEFMKKADVALDSGVKFINDLAESKLIRNIQDGQNTAIIYWLKNRNRAYSEKMLHRHMHEVMTREVDPETQAMIRKAMGNFARKVKQNEKEGIGKGHFIPKKKAT